MQETAEVLIGRAESAGFALRREGGLAIATLPAAADETETESVLQELIMHAPEISRALRARDAAARSRRFAGWPALCTSLLEVGTVESRDEGGRLVVRCLNPRGENTLPLVVPPDEVMLVAEADKHRPRMDVSSASGDPERNWIRRAEKHGVRFWAEDGLVVFGWPGLANRSIVPFVLREAIAESANWGAMHGRSSSPRSTVLASEAICEGFVDHVARDNPLGEEFACRKRGDRMSAALLLLVSLSSLQSLRQEFHCDALAIVGADSEDSHGMRAFVSESGLTVSIEGRDGELLACRDRTGRPLRLEPERLLAVEAERPTERRAAPAEQKPRLLASLRW